MPASETTSIILRYRDLVTAPGGTLTAHDEQRAASGSVWWGWWSKLGERVPSEEFAHLTRLARAQGGLEIWLFDSGREQLFRARCTDIVWDPVSDRIPSPDAAKTPAYYGSQQYLAWFKLTELSLAPEPDPDATLQRFSYERVDAFFDDASSRYGDFYGKQVSSVDELRQQERTIWFVRPFRQSDPHHQIRLLDARQLSPTHYPAHYEQSPSVRLLWLSDVHCSIDGEHAFPTTADEAASPLGPRIEQACRDHGVTDLAGLILSGDLAWKADPAEFEQARQIAAHLQHWASLERYQVAVCPGNHDVAFSTTPWVKNSTVARSEAVARAGYEEFYSKMFYMSPNEFLTCGRRFLLGGAVPVEIVCLNSSFLGQQAGMFVGHGFVGERQLRDAAEQMGWDAARDVGGPRPLRVVVVHHHLLPVTFREAPGAGWTYSVMLDAEALTRWIARYGVQVVLHGHMHTPFYSQVTRRASFQADESSRHRFHVFGMGSSGVHQRHWGEIKGNAFAVLTFGRESLTVVYYGVHPTDPSQEIARYTVAL